MTIARVMKSDEVTEALAAGRYNYEDLRVRCEVYLESIREQAKSILLEAQVEADKIRQQSEEEGRRRGLEHGLQQAQKEIKQKIEKSSQTLTEKRMKAVVPQLAEAVAEIKKLQDEAESYWQQQGVQLAVAIAEKLIHRAILDDPSIVNDRLQEILSMVIGESHLQITLSAEDVQRLESQQEQIANFVRAVGLEWSVDDSLSSGDFRIHTHYGEIDARVDTQLDRIAE